MSTLTLVASGIFNFGLQNTKTSSHSTALSAVTFKQCTSICIHFRSLLWVQLIRGCEMVPVKVIHGFYGTLRHNECLVIWAQHTERIVQSHIGKVMFTFHVAKLR